MSKTDDQLLQIEQKLNRLRSEKERLNTQLKKSEKTDRMKRSRSLIQAGGILYMLEFLELFGLQVGDDFQLDMSKKENAICMIGYFLDVKEQTPDVFTDEQMMQFLLKGQQFLNARSEQF